MIKKPDLLKKQVFVEDFDSYEEQEVYSEFRSYSEREIPIPKNLKLIFAEYTYKDYSGSAYVLGYNKTTRKFFEVAGGHCSCYGLEGQWDEEYFDSYKQMLDSIKIRSYNSSSLKSLLEIDYE